MAVPLQRLAARQAYSPSTRVLFRSAAAPRRNPGLGHRFVPRQTSCVSCLQRSSFSFPSASRQYSSQSSSNPTPPRPKKDPYRVAFWPFAILIGIATGAWVLLVNNRKGTLFFVRASVLEFFFLPPSLSPSCIYSLFRLYMVCELPSLLWSCALYTSVLCDIIPEPFHSPSPKLFIGVLFPHRDRGDVKTRGGQAQGDST